MEIRIKIAGMAVPLVLMGGMVDAVTFLPQTTPQLVTAVPVSSYVLTAFSFNMSAGVGLAYAENSTQVSVQTGHSKGTTTFGSQSGGGAVAQCQTPPNTSTGFTLVPNATGNGCT